MLMMNVHIDIGPGRTTVKNKNPPVQKSRKTKETAPVGHAFCEMECFYFILHGLIFVFDCSATRPIVTSLLGNFPCLS